MKTRGWTATWGAAVVAALSFAAAGYAQEAVAPPHERPPCLDAESPDALGVGQAAIAMKAAEATVRSY